MLVAVVLAACGSGPVPDYSNCGEVTPFGACEAGAGGALVCDTLCACITAGSPDEEAGCVADCAADPDVQDFSDACEACILESTCTELLDQAGPCTELCAPAATPAG